MVDLAFPLQHQFRSVASIPGDLKEGQIAVDQIDGKIFIGDGTDNFTSSDGTVVGTSTITNMGWKEYTLTPSLLAVLLAPHQVWGRLPINTNTPIVQATHNRTKIIVSTGITLTFDGTNVDDGFECHVYNVSGADLTLVVVDTIDFGSVTVPTGTKVEVYYNETSNSWILG